MHKQIFFAITLIQLMTSHAGAVEAPKPLKIGVLADLAGPYSDVSGKGAVEAAKMAAEAFGGKVAGRPIQIVVADHQNKADVAAEQARRWFDVDGVDAVTDLINSAGALAVNQIGKEKNKAVLVSGAGVSDLTGARCTPTTVHWTYDTAAIAQATTTALVNAGLKRWYFITADYAFGSSMQRDATASIEKAGGAVVGSVKHPLSPPDFSSFLLSAQSSKAQVIALANAGADTTNAIKQAAEFGVGRGNQRLTGLLVTVAEVHSIGLEKAQGLIVTTPFYWDRDENTRKFAVAFAKRTGGRYPTMMQAGVYGSVLHYLKAVDALKGKSDDGAAVVGKMKELPTDDPLFGKGVIQKNGRKVHPMYVYQVKSPAESRGEWDLYKLLYTVKPEQAFRSVAESGCALAK